MCKKRKFDYMSGYMSVLIDGTIFRFSDDCPPELKEKVLKEWPAYKKEVEELHKKAIVLRKIGFKNLVSERKKMQDLEDCTVEKALGWNKAIPNEKMQTRQTKRSLKILSKHDRRQRGLLLCQGM